MLLNTVKAEAVDRDTPSQALQPGETPSSSQLLNAIEFSNRFPELTLHLVASMRKKETVNPPIPTAADMLNDFKFPLLVAADPKKIAAEKKKKHLEQRQLTEEQVFLPVTNRPVPESASRRMIQPKKRAAVRPYLLTAAVLVSLLLWFSVKVMRPEREHTAASAHLPEILHLRAEK